MNIPDKNQDDRYFRTSSFYAACFLFVKGMELVGIEPDSIDQKRYQFTFRDSPYRESLLQSFNFSKENDPEVLVDIRKVITAIKTLKDALYQSKKL